MNMFEKTNGSMTKYLALSFYLLNLSACGQSTSSTISVEAFQKLQQQRKDLIILDVRTPGEVVQGKINGAVEIDYRNSEFKKRVAELDKTKPIVVYCATGYRSENAARYMKSVGFKELSSLEGGIVAWQKKGLPVVR
jgi:rhodanese-related sulfurtransferase